MTLSSGEIAALNDDELILIAAVKLGYMSKPSGVTAAWNECHLIGAVWRDRIRWIWILDVDNVPENRIVYCDSGTHAGTGIRVQQLATDAVNNANPNESGETWQESIRLCIAAWQQ